MNAIVIFSELTSLSWELYSNLDLRYLKEGKCLYSVYFRRNKEHVCVISYNGGNQLMALFRRTRFSAASIEVVLKLMACEGQHAVYKMID